jgi:hypothetical protein
MQVVVGHWLTTDPNDFPAGLSGISSRTAIFSGALWPIRSRQNNIRSAVEGRIASVRRVTYARIASQRRFSWMPTTRRVRLPVLGRGTVGFEGADVGAVVDDDLLLVGDIAAAAAGARSTSSSAIGSNLS